jgi:hypothetical protein
VLFHRTSNVASALAPGLAAAVDRPLAERVPWTVWISALATVSVVIGDVWDISWHISVGRDTFWTPPHMLIQLCAAIGGLTAVYLIIKTTFAGDRASRDRSVRIFGLHAPLGAFLCGWGALAMVASAPFDNWWHEAYGLDVKVISPPHSVLFIGAFAVILGGFLLTAAPLNRAASAMNARLDGVFIGLIGVLMLGAQADLIECSNRALMHSAIFYRCFAVPFPVLLMTVRRISRRPWACTSAAAVYTAAALAQEWVLPLFAAEQKLGPVYQRVPYMVPLGFPILMIVVAAAIDLAWTRVRDWRAWKQAAALGVLFLATLVAVQWPFADFLISPRSGNWIFGTHYQMYMAGPNDRSCGTRFMRSSAPRPSSGGVSRSPSCSRFS